jgi:hypothetical protein
MTEVDQIKSTLELLEKELKLLKDVILETTESIRSEGFSKYPIIISHNELIPFGELVLDKNEFNLAFNYSATTLEDLIKRQIIPIDKVKSFVQEWEKEQGNTCVFLLIPQTQRFIFTKLI